MRPNRREAIGAVAGSLVLGAGAAPVLAVDERLALAFTLLLVNDIYLMDEVEGRGGFACLNVI